MKCLYILFIDQASTNHACRLFDSLASSVTFLQWFGNLHRLQKTTYWITYQLFISLYYLDGFQTKIYPTSSAMETCWSLVETFQSTIFFSIQLWFSQYSLKTAYVRPNVFYPYLLKQDKLLFINHPNSFRCLQVEMLEILISTQSSWWDVLCKA